MPDQKTYTAADFAKAEFARHPNRFIAARVDDSSMPGRTSGVGGDEWMSDREMAENGWSPVRECPNPDDHVLVQGYPAIADLATQWQERAEKAEQERDHWKREADGANADLAGLRAMTAREHLDATWEAAYVPEDGIIPAGAAYMAIEDDGTVVTGTSHSAFTSSNGIWSHRLLDAPTPKRPEWADAPAVYAVCTADRAKERRLWWRDETDSWRSVDGRLCTATKTLIDVTPLYPKGARVTEGGAR